MATCGPILLVDDDASCRSLVAEVLQRDGFETIEAADGKEALKQVKEHRPAAVVLDVHLPVVPGYTVLKELRQRYGNDVPVILISGERVESFDRVGGLMLGADDYVVKPFDPDELAARVARCVARVEESRSKGARPDATSAVADLLTPREREVLGRMMEGQRQNQIAAQLSISPKTVATHIQRMLSKLGVHSRVEAVALGHQQRLAEGNGDVKAHWLPIRIRRGTAHGARASHTRRPAS